VTIKLFLSYHILSLLYFSSLDNLSYEWPAMNDERSYLDGSHVCHWAMCLHRLQLLQAPFQFFQRFQCKSTLLVVYIQLTREVTFQRSRTSAIIAVVFYSENICFIAALHGMQMRSSDENLSVRPSVRPSACLSNAWIATKRKKDLSRFFLYHTKGRLA